MVKRYLNPIIGLILGIAVLLFILCKCNSSFFKLEASVKKDYLNNKETFMELMIEYREKEGIIKKEEYDKHSKELNRLFNELDYEFIRFNKYGIFFCKGYDGMSGIGLLYTKDISSMETIKDKVIEEIEENWFLFSEHYL